jgi:hypothetical protein
MKAVKTGFVYGTGAAVNVECGFIPDLVILWNHTDGDVMNLAMPSVRTMAFSSGGTSEIKAGHYIRGATSNARALVKQVLTDTGTWAGGDAAGTLILDSLSIEGTFTSESIYIEGESGTDDATGAAVGTIGVDSDTEIANDTGITPYTGAAGTNSVGFTLATAVSEDAKLLVWTAFRF